MSLNKAIKYWKEHRRQYIGAKNVSPHCRNHGGCFHCLQNRLYKLRKTVDAAESRLKDENIDR